MTKKTREYRFSHKIAKAIMCVVVLILLFLDGSLTLLNALAIIVWVFGTNPIAYIVEHVFHIKHRHDKL